MKKMWCRVGVSIELTDFQYEMFVKAYKENCVESHSMLKCLLESDCSKLDGDTYFPEDIFTKNDNIYMEFNF